MMGAGGCCQLLDVPVRSCSVQMQMDRLQAWKPRSRTRMPMPISQGEVS